MDRAAAVARSRRAGLCAVSRGYQSTDERALTAIISEAGNRLCCLILLLRFTYCINTVNSADNCTLVVCLTCKCPSQPDAVL